VYMRRTKGAKRDPVKQWALPDRVFFACGACHVPEHTGNHIVVLRNDLAFDYQGFCAWSPLFAHMRRRAQQWSPGWEATLVPLPEDALVSEPRSRAFEGLWLKEPQHFLFEPIPRAEVYLRRFPAPPADLVAAELSCWSVPESA
jgi:hypothetical protein